MTIRPEVFRDVLRDLRELAAQRALELAAHRSGGGGGFSGTETGLRLGSAGQR
jgi:hypothetical protein